MRSMMHVHVILSIILLFAQDGLCKECREDQEGKDYSGKVSQTVSGRTCQAWSSQTPHRHGGNGVENYCGNPDNEPGGPWCYTTDPNMRWEYCHVPSCESDKGCDINVCKDKSCTIYPNAKCSIAYGGCTIRWYEREREVSCENNDQCKVTNEGQEYMGSVSKTKRGVTCQRWDAQAPHSHRFNKNHEYWMEDRWDHADNKCRNPDGEALGPWCYTTDERKRWDYCDVPFCSECRKTQLGLEYTGLVAKTVTGKTCQDWDQQTCNKRANHMKGQKNFCRNPDNKPGGPWCYTTDPDMPWEFCFVPSCYDDITCVLPPCRYNPCENKTCAAVPEAKCTVPFCGGCSTVWYHEKKVVDCNQ